MTIGLDAGPTATTFYLEDLVTQAWRGYVRVPHFQRDFRWGKQDVIRLFDSIVRGYPIGSLLMWVRAAPAQWIKLGALDIDAPSVDRAYWVVDGQQRVTSLANALHEGGRHDPRFGLVYDLRSRRFSARPSNRDPWEIPLPIIFDLQRLIRWFSEYPELADELDAATSVAKTIRQFKIPAYQVEGEDEAVLTDIFDRMNNYGKRLSRAEVFSALYAGAEGEQATTLDIDVIAENIDADLGFGMIDDDTVLRAILARRGPDVTREIRNEFSDHDRRGSVEFRGEGREAAYLAGEEALRRAVRFLQEEAGVPHFTFLPYRYLLVVLSRLFAHHPNPDVRSITLLRRWFWRAAVVGPEIFKGNVTGGMRLLCGKVVPERLSLSVQGLLIAIRRINEDYPDLERFRTNESATKTILCSWWFEGPRSLMTGDAYERPDLSKILTDRPTAADAVRYILGRRSVPRKYAMWAANRMLLPSEEDPVDELDDRLSSGPLTLDPYTWDQALKSHAMSDQMTSYLNGRDLNHFFKLRQRELAERLARFLDSMCEWEHEDTPPLDALVIEDFDDIDDEKV